MFQRLFAVWLLFSFATTSFAQQSLIGTYKMVSQVLDIDGQPTENMGKAPRGYLVFTSTRAIAFYTSESRKPGGTEADKAALFDSLGGWSGNYRIEGKRLIVSIDTSWVETWNGKDQIRTWEVLGRRLTLTSDPVPYARPVQEGCKPAGVGENRVRGSQIRKAYSVCDAQPSDAADRFTAGFRPLFRGR